MKVLMMMGVILAASSVLTGCSTSQGDLLPTGDANDERYLGIEVVMIAILHLIGTPNGRLIDAPKLRFIS